MIIRPAILDDLEQLRRVYAAASLSNPSDRDALLQNPEYLVLGGAGISAGRTRVALLDDRVVGFASLAEGSSGVLELEDLFVDPEWHRRGIARRLVGELVEIVRRSGQLTLEVTGNPDALAFYRALGFIEIGNVATDLGPAPRLRLALI